MEKNYSREEMISMAMDVSEAYLLGLGIQLSARRTFEDYLNIFDKVMVKFERENQSFNRSNLIFSESEIIAMSKSISKAYVHLCTSSIGPSFIYRAAGCYFDMFDYAKEQLESINQAKLENITEIEVSDDEKTHKM